MPLDDAKVIDLIGEVKVLCHRVTDFDKKLDDLHQEYKDMKESHVLNEEHRDLAKRVDKLESHIGWTIKGIVTAVLSAILALVFKKGSV